MANRLFYGKILLFGEYSILAGSDAAIIPYRSVKARLGFFRECRQPDIMLQAFHDYLEQDVLCREYVDLQRFQHDIDEGVSLKSDIPMNMGLGSSGAICAAVYSHYGIKEINGTSRLTALFSNMESWFHGKSSGIDPLCIYLDKPLIRRKLEFSAITDDTALRNNRLRPFLINTGNESLTKPLVDHFRDQMENTEFASGFIQDYVPLVNAAVDEWSNGSLSENTLLTLSERQLTLFERMIPADFRKIWQEGLALKTFDLKLCGSGGGGMLLGFAEDIEKVKSTLFEKQGIVIHTDVFR